MPPTDTMFSTTPPLSFIHAFHAARTNRSGPVTLASRILVTAPRSASISGANEGLIAALFDDRVAAAEAFDRRGDRGVGEVDVADRTLDRAHGRADRAERGRGLLELGRLAGEHADARTGRGRGLGDGRGRCPGSRR